MPGVFSTLNGKNKEKTVNEPSNSRGSSRGSGGVFTQIKKKETEEITKAAGLAKLSRIKDDPNTPQPKAPRKPTIVEELKQGLAPKRKSSLPLPQVVNRNNPISKLMAQEKVNLKHAQEYDDRQAKAKAAQAAATKASKAKWDNEHGRNKPVIGKVLRGVDAVGEFIKPATDVAQTLYTPGAGVTVVNMATKSAGNLIGKLIPSLVKTAAGRVAKTAATEAAVGVPLAVGNKLARDPNASGKELIEEGAYGAVGGGLVGGLARGGKEVVRWGVDTVKRSAAEVAGKQLQAVDDAVRADLPPTIRRLANKDSVPDLFPERFRRTVSGGASDAVQTGEVAARTGTAESLREIRNEAVNQNEPPTIARARMQAEQTAATTEAPRAQRVDTTFVNERGNYRNQRENGNFSDDFNEGLNNRDTTYEQLPNAVTVARANENVKNMTGAEASFLGNQEYSAEHIATGYRLMQELDRMGQLEKEPALRKVYTERALNVSEKLAVDLTRGGQTLQAASILQRLSPEGQLMHLQRQAKKAGKVVSVVDADMYRTLAKDVQQSTVSGSATSQFLDVLDRLKAGKPVSADEMKKASLILEDAKRYVKTADNELDQVVDVPEELKDVRKRDKVLSYLEQQAADARKQWNAKRNIGFAQKIGEADIVLLTKMGTYQLAKAGVTLADFTEAMVKEFGETVRPHMKDVFERSKKLMTGTSKHISDGKLEQANDAFRRLSGQAQAEKAVVVEMASHVKKVIADAKAGKFDLDDIQKIRELSDEISEFPVSMKQPSEEQQFLRNVKALAKKIAEVDTQKTATSQTKKEVATLLRQVTKLTAKNEAVVGLPPLLDTQAMNNLAHDLLQKTRPNPAKLSAAEKVMEKFIRQNGVSTDDEKILRELSKQVNELSGAKGMKSNMKMQQILNSYQKSSLGAKISTIRYMSMLLNSATQLVNTISGPLMMTYNQMLDVVATPFDAMYAAVTKGERTTTWKQGPGAFDNLFAPVVDWFKGIKVGGEAGWKGVDPEGIATQHDIRGLAFKSKLNPFGLAERSLGAISKGPDYATYIATKNMELRKLAHLDAMNKHVKGKQNIRAHMDRFLADPPAKALEQAARLGKKITFQNTNGIAGKAANLARKANELTGSEHIGIANMVVPFIRTPTNIAITGVENTPAGILKGIFEINRLRNGADDITKREILKTFVSATAGGTGVLGGLGYILSDLGIVTGDNAVNNDVRELQEAVGEGKFRFNTTAFGRMFNALLDGDMGKLREVSKYKKGDKQFDYNKLQPLALPFAGGATLAEQRELAKYAKARGEEYPFSKQLEKAASAAGTSLYGMSSLQGLQNTFRTDISSEVPPWQQVLQNIEESFVKGFSPSGLAQEARRQDPIQREVSYNKSFKEDVGSHFKSRLPGKSQSLPPRITNLGETKENAPGIKGQYLNPMRSEQAKYNEAAEIIYELIKRTGNLKLAPTPVDKDVEGKKRGSVEKVKIKLTPERYTKLQEDVGRRIVEKILALPSSMSDQRKAQRIEEIYKQVRDTERNKLKRELGIVVNF